MSDDNPATRLQAFNENLNAIRRKEEEAINRLNELMSSEDFKSFLITMAEVKKDLIAGGHYDRVIGSAISVLETTRIMVEQTNAAMVGIIAGRNIPTV